MTDQSAASTPERPTGHEDDEQVSPSEPWLYHDREAQEDARRRLDRLVEFLVRDARVGWLMSRS